MVFFFFCLNNCDRFSFLVPTEEEEEEGENPFIPHSKKKDIEKEGIEVYRIPFIHRASSIAINKEGNDFAVTQVTPTLR